MTDEIDDLGERLWRAIAAGKLALDARRFERGLRYRFHNGLLAYLGRGYRAPLTVLKGSGGYYIGTIDPKGRPGPRESIEFWPRRKDAETALAERKFRQRIAL